MNADALARNLVVAEMQARFEAIFVPYPPHLELHSRCDHLRQLGLRTKGRPQKGFRVLAPTGSGKTTALDAYIASVEAARPRTEDFIPILKISIANDSTPRRLMTSVLDAFGDMHAHHGNEALLRRRAIACFQRFKTELLICDEVQHLNYRQGPKTDVTDTLKGLLDMGVVPIIFLGTEDAKNMFGRNLQLNGRLLPPCDLPPLDVRRPADRALFARFVTELEGVVFDQNLLPQRSNLNALGMMPALFEVSNGVIGRVSRLINVALGAAIMRGGQCLEVQDLSWAIDHWAVEQGFVKRNPLEGRHG
ncbi:MAG: ATP-binding protein [Alphaproteobacteria bacterium]|jgi:hypothetical protein|uniref:TniB family NTP-binding protein n=1 Tax=Rhizobium oryzihabitans TaxID=2267833 RepID=UPI004035DB26|nr:ATP-binding protein [Alphaproteobacteria bacterium]